MINEALDKAVIELKGVLPSLIKDKRNNVNGWYLDASGMLTHKDYCIWFKCDQFIQRAKELGFINGYRYGVEYQTNGKRPDLPDDVVIQCKGKKGVWFSDDAVVEWSWNYVTEFRITDPRYKPADTSYLNASSQDQGLTHKSADETISLISTTWYDYENQKALRLPDVGVECYRKVGINLLKTSIVAHHHDGFRAIFCDEGFSIGELGYCAAVSFKPLDHATRKAELEKKRVVTEAQKVCVNFASKDLGALYEAGYLRLPANKD